MALVTRRDNGNRIARDPFAALARDLFAWEGFGENARPTNFAPRFEVKENAEAFEIRADLPGVKDEDLDISLHEGVLSITGSRAAAQKQEGEAYYVYERQFGSFSRSFALPEVADGNKVTADLTAGVLTVKIAKKEAAKPRKIDLKKA